MSLARGQSPFVAPFPLALVGIGCRYPGEANDPESFWKLLADSRSGIGEVPANRWNRERYYHPDISVPGVMLTKRGGFVGNLDRFDARFWGISPREAHRMDPQQRWLLECAWEALEDSGTSPRKVRKSSIGVFVGVASNDFASLQLSNYADTDVHTLSGCTLSIASNRVSYLLDLRGPSVSIDTACSSSLVAVWMAAKSLWSGACSGALVGGVNALIVPDASIGFSKASMLSPDAQCFAFDARANGYVRSEGAGVIYLKPLDQALADRDRIYAVLRSAVSNQDGNTSSMTIPSADSQAALLVQAYREAGVEPKNVVYVEAHGTGTPVGDPIEAAALGRVLGPGRGPGERCLIGSVKTNIGHLEAGSGIAGMIKAALVLHKNAIPANQNFRSPSPRIRFDELGLQVASRLQPLPPGVGRPVVSVNSFGFGGTNAHVVLEQAPEAPAEIMAPVAPARVSRPYLLPISASHPAALREYVISFERLLSTPHVNLGGVCFTAGARKEHHEHRLVVQGESVAEIRGRLAAYLEKASPAAGVVAGRVSPAATAPVFVYTGQGGQWWHMGCDLLKREPVFRGMFEKIDALLTKLAGWSLLSEMTRPEAESNIDRTDIAQPAIFALQVALTELWKSWGVEPSRVVGHSVGEVAAAYAAGIYSLADATKVIFERARLQHTTRGGGRMLAVGLSAADANAAIGNDQRRVAVAAVNGPQLVTLAGDTEPLEHIARNLEQAGTFVRWLRISYAFHTHQMDPLRDELLHVLAGIRPRPERIPFHSTVTGGRLSGTELTAAYWWKNVRQPVLFAPAIDALIAESADAFLEIGPHPALTSSITECLSARECSGKVVHSLRRGTDESEELLTNLAGLHLADVPFDWGAVNRSREFVTDLPAYPWQREVFWIESEPSQKTRTGAIEHPLLGVRTEAALPTWQSDFHLGRLAYLRDHRLWDGVVFPAAGFAEIGVAVTRALFPGEPFVVEVLEIIKALSLSDEVRTQVQIAYDPELKRFTVFSKSSANGSWEIHARGRLTRLTSSAREPLDILAVRQRLTEHLDKAKFYEDMVEAGYQFGPLFQQVENVWRCPGEALMEIVVPDSFRGQLGAYHNHPAVLDSAFHIFKGLDPSLTKVDFFLPASIGRVSVKFPEDLDRFWAHGRLRSREPNQLVCDISLYDRNGRALGEILEFLAIRAVQQRAGDDLIRNCYRLAWDPAAAPPSSVPEAALELPPSNEIANAAKASLPAARARHNLGAYRDQFVPRAEALALGDVRQAWRELGWRPEIGERVTSDALCARLGIVPAYRRLTAAQLTDQSDRGWLRQRQSDEWEVIASPDFSSDDSWHQLAADLPEFAIETALQLRTSSNLAAILSGAENVFELLFPGGSTELLEEFYLKARDYPVHDQLLSNALQFLMERWPKHRRVRILEVGGGTGSLTRRLLPLLPADRTEYVFTDISPAFVSAARTAFASHPFVRYQTFDLEKPFTTLNLPGSFDLIVGSLVLHATDDVKRVLSSLRSRLTPGGMLLALEIFPPQIYTTNVFGLLPGWWRFSDVELRQHSPLLPRERWLSLLGECGFEQADSFSAAPAEVDADHAFLMAFAPQTQAALPPPSDKTYLVLADVGGVADAVAARLNASGFRSVVVRAGSEFARAGENEYSVRIASSDDMQRVLADVAGPLEGIVHGWSLDHGPVTGMSLSEVWRAQETGLFSALRLLHTLGAAPPPRVWFLTRNVHRVENDDRVEGLVSAPLTGLLRVANNEIFSTRFGQIDVGSATSAAEIAAMCEDITRGEDELELAYRSGQRYVLRLRRANPDQLPLRLLPVKRVDGSDRAFRLLTKKPGVLTNLGLYEKPRTVLGPREVEIRVLAGGINFRDVLKALGAHPGSAADLLWLGDDVSGIVERVGSEVQRLAPGDEVFAHVLNGFQSHINAPEECVYKKWPHLSFAEAATIPTVFLTTHYALVDLVRMQPGEKILIHAAAGGVGQAAIQVARHLGLEIFATAGSPAKRKLVRSLGVEHVLNSRTLKFADDIRELTNGYGVDAVLNSLSGDFIPKSLSVLAPFGRFIEIGKIDIYGNTQVGLEQFKHNIAYYVVDLLEVVTHRPDRVAAAFEAIGKHFAAGVYRPIEHTVYPITQAAEAFRQVAQGQHTGKQVLSFDVPGISIGLCADESNRFEPDATYLVTGGAGGFGLEIAAWMCRHGAREIALMSRGGPRDEASHAKIAALQADGVVVHELRGDVAVLSDVERCLSQLAAEAPPLKGIVHGAMVLDDDFLPTLDETRFVTALSPKMAGAWNLHTASLSLPLDHFICLSSFSSVIGGSKQANYNAGNHFLDALADYRRARGLPALTVNWGALLGAGFVERHRKTADFLETAGFKSITIQEALDALARLIVLDAERISVARIEWPNLPKIMPNLGRSATFSELTQESKPGERSGSLLARFHQTSAELQPRVLEEFIAAQLAEVLDIDPEKMDYELSLTKLGLDSLMSLDLANRLEREVGAKLSMSSLLGGPSIRALAVTIVKMLTKSTGDAALADVDSPKAVVPLGPPPSRSSVSAGEGGDPFSIRMVRGLDAKREVSQLTFDAAALLYVPERVQSLGGLTDEQISTMLGDEPFVSHVYELKYGKIGVITLPVLGRHLFRSPRLAELTRRAIATAQRHGATCASLTGLIPSATRYGLDVKNWIGDSLAITTGHATTTSAVVLNLEHLLGRVGRTLDAEILAVLGLGSIGQTCVELALRVLPHPKAIYLCDIFGKADDLRHIAVRLRDDLGFRGEIQVLLSAESLPPELYEATTILTAVSVPNLIEVARLNPGTVVIDDSYPPAFPLEEAIERAELAGDILFSNAGMSRTPDRILETVYLSEAVDAEVARFGAEAFRAQVARDPNELTACFLSSLLTGRFEGFCPTVGVASAKEVLSHYQALGRLGINAARPQCGNYFLSNELVDRFRDRFAIAGSFTA